MEEITKSMHWRAIYKSGEALEQLENTQEILYENIDKTNLKAFFLLGGLVDVGVNLEKGTLVLDEKEILLRGFSNSGNAYRLIYYVKEIGVIGAKRASNKIYYLGMQTTVDEKNLKFLASIEQNKIGMKVY